MMLRGRHLGHVFQNCGKALRQPVRHLSLLEYHSHKLLSQYNIPVPTGVVVDTPEHARSVVSAIGAPSMLKSQILAGGRGKGKFDTDGKGGVRMVSTPAEAFENASQMLGHYLTTKQTPPKGLLVKKLYIYKAEDVAHEYYVAVTFDRQQSSPVLLISGEGGVNVESKADQLHRFWFSPSRGVTPELFAAVRSRLLFSTAEMPIIERIIQQLVKLFVEKDAILLELNPLVLTTDGRFVCLDAKFDLDDAARFRQQGLYSLEEPTPDLAEEQEASRHGLVYIRLDGNIGNVVNGAGLAMATNDLINLHGGKSANFLDIGGKATGETLWQAVEMLNRDPHVQGMWINIFGGIVRCDMIAQSIVDAGSAMGGFRMPVVVRLQGTNSDEAQQIIQKSGMDLHTESDFELAARRIIELTPRSG